MQVANYGEERTSSILWRWRRNAQLIILPPTILKAQMWAHFSACEFVGTIFNETEGTVQFKKIC